MEDVHAFPLIMNFLIMPLFSLSGALFPLKGLPHSIQVITHANPLTYGVDGIRGVLTDQIHLTFFTDFVVFSAFVAVALLCGRYLFSKIEV